jgi:dipeptidyl aminopeptidase/acylaminoacyl peptidase
MLMGWTGDDARLESPAFPGVSSRIHAVVDLYGVPDIRLPLSKGTRACGEGWIGGKMAEQPALFELLSPISHITNDSAPVLILHGTADTTVPISQTEALVKVLEARRARYQYKVVPDAPHTFLISSTPGDCRELIVNSFRENLR